LSNTNKYWLLGVVFLFFLHWYGDSLDGTIARLRKIERERFGYFIDHVSDMFATIFILVGLGLSNLASLQLSTFLIVAYFQASINTYLSAYSGGIFKYTMGRLGPTEIRLIIVIITPIVFFNYPGNITLLTKNYKIFNIAEILALIVLGFLTLRAIIKNIIYLNKIDKPT
jgi:phosphatidylglycerophosphate synthase